MKLSRSAKNGDRDDMTVSNKTTIYTQSRFNLNTHHTTHFKHSNYQIETFGSDVSIFCTHFWGVLQNYAIHLTLVSNIWGVFLECGVCLVPWYPPLSESCQIPSMGSQSVWSEDRAFIIFKPVTVNNQTSGWVMHICVGTSTIIGSDNGLSPGRRQVIIWTNAGILLIRHLETNLSEFLIAIKHFNSRSCVQKGRLRNRGHFVSASMC